MSLQNIKELLFRAVECDKQYRLLEAQHLYEEATIALKEYKDGQDDAEKKKVFDTRIAEYSQRAEAIKAQFKRKTLEQSQLIEQVNILENSKGHSYATLFGKYLDSDIKEVKLVESYLSERHHVQNLVMFFELLVKRCQNLKFIQVITKPTERQQSNLQQIVGDMQTHGISVRIKYDEKQHDRKIILSNGYIIKIGRGLDIYHPSTPQFSLGLCDYDFRRCKQTEIDIIRLKRCNVPWARRRSGINHIQNRTKKA